MEFLLSSQISRLSLRSQANLNREFFKNNSQKTPLKLIRPNPTANLRQPKKNLPKPPNRSLGRKEFSSTRTRPP